MDIPDWKLDDLTGREAYEALLARLAGAGLTHQLGVTREARLAVQATLSGDQRDLFITYADACADASAVREEAAGRAGLCYGVAIGAALARFPALDAEAVADTAAEAASAVLGAALPVALAREVARAAIEALALADAA